MTHRALADIEKRADIAAMTSQGKRPLARMTEA
jgi:hypothetical protein